jgi:hypothetical protein
VKKMPDNSHRYRLYEPVLFAHSNGASHGDAGCREFHSTHGGFNGPFKVEIEARAQEGRACEDQAPLGSRQQPREEGQARRRQAARPAGRKAQDGEEEGSAQEVGTQSGTEGKGAEHDADVVRADVAAIVAATDDAEAGGTADVAATPGGTAIAAAAVDAIFRLEFVVDLVGV